MLLATASARSARALGPARPTAVVVLALMLLLGGLTSPAMATVLKVLDFDPPGLFTPSGKPWQWQGYVPKLASDPASGITLGSPGELPPGYHQAARFDPPNLIGKPRSMAKLSKTSVADGATGYRGRLDAAEGLERWYLWYTYLPADFTMPETHLYGMPTVLHAWHNDSSRSSCNPNQQLHVRRTGPGEGGLRLSLKVQGGRHSTTLPTDWSPEGWNGGAGGALRIYCYAETARELDLGPIVKGQWMQFAMHVRWSSDPDQGLTEVWRDGVLTSSATGRPNGGANLYRDALGSEQGYLEQGIYMPNDPTARDRAAWHVGMRIADSPTDSADEMAGWLAHRGLQP